MGVVWRVLRQQIVRRIKCLREGSTRQEVYWDDSSEVEVFQKQKRQETQLSPQITQRRAKALEVRPQRNTAPPQKRAAPAPRTDSERDPFNDTPPTRALRPLRVYEHEALSHRDIAAILIASSPIRRREIAQSIPEIEQPQPYQSLLAREILRRYYLEGQKGADFNDLGLEQNAVSQLARTYLAEIIYYRTHPEHVNKCYSEAFDPGWAAFYSSRTELERRFAYKEHPELSTWLRILEKRDAKIMKLLYRKGLTLTQAAKSLEFSKEFVRQRRNRAVSRLNFYDRELGLQADAESKRDKVRQALQSYPTLEDAANGVGVTSQELLGVIERLKMPLSVATPERSPSDDPRMLELLGAKRVTERRKIARAHPELSPPYPFLSDESNLLLERVLWQGKSYREACVGLPYLSYEGARKLVECALKTMHTYLREQPLEYYRRF